MEAKENWISPDGYAFDINHLNQDMIKGDFKVRYNGDHVFIPFEGLINICFDSQLEFCFIVDWQFYVSDAICYTSFLGKNYFNNDLEYVSLKWLLVYETNSPNMQSLSVKGKNRFVKVSDEIDGIDSIDGANNLPYPFYIDIIKTNMNIERSEC